MLASVTRWDRVDASLLAEQLDTTVALAGTRLQKLAARGYLERAGVRHRAIRGRPPTLFRLTPAGRARLVALGYSVPV